MLHDNRRQVGLTRLANNAVVIAVAAIGIIVLRIRIDPTELNAAIGQAKLLQLRKNLIAQIRANGMRLVVIARVVRRPNLSAIGITNTGGVQMQAHQHIGTLVERTLHALAQLTRRPKSIVGRHGEHRSDFLIGIKLRLAELGDLPCGIRLRSTICHGTGAYTHMARIERNHQRTGLFGVCRTRATRCRNCSRCRLLDRGRLCQLIATITGIHVQVGAACRLAIRIGKRHRRNFIAAIRLIDLGKVDLIGGTVRLELKARHLAGAHPRGKKGEQQGIVLHTRKRACLLGSCLVLDRQDSSRHPRMLRE